MVVKIHIEKIQNGWLVQYGCTAQEFIKTKQDVVKWVKEMLNVK